MFIPIDQGYESVVGVWLNRFVRFIKLKIVVELIFLAWDYAQVVLELIFLAWDLYKYTDIYKYT